LLPVIEHAKKVYIRWLPIRRNIARDERFGIGKRIDELLILTLEHLREAAYAGGNAKIALLGQAIRHIDLLRFFLQLAWEGKVIEQKHYIVLATEIESLGKMVGGWRKGLLAKTPPLGK
jgi:hypothetical protein